MNHRQHYLDANTRRYPRTLQQAFGPYTSSQLDDPTPYRGPFWTPVRVAFALTYLAAFITLWAVL